MSHTNYITQCPIIPDPELKWSEMPRAFKMAFDDTLRFLEAKGIHDRIDTHLRTFTGDRQCWLALYVRDSQFHGTPIIEVNTQTPGILDAAVLPQSITVEDVFLDSILHEYGHIIEEWARKENKKMNDIINHYFNGEEDFAEYMVDYFRHSKNNNRKTITDKIIKMYIEDAFQG